MKLPRTLVLVALLASASDVEPARAASDCDLDCWRAALELYAASPAVHGRSLVELSRGGMEGLPPIAHLAVADARLRLGQRRAADRVFQDVIDGTTDEPWRSWAVTGRAWVAMQRGDVRGARHLLLTHTTSGEPDDVVFFAFGMLEAGRGDPVAGIELLEAVRTRETSPRSLRIAAEMGIGLAHSWSGSHGLALEIFEGLAARPAALAVRDEALFAAARTRIELGDEAGGFRLLEELAASAGESPSPAARWNGVADLSAPAILGAGGALFREGRVAAPSQIALALFDWDGAALAARLVEERRVADGRTAGSFDRDAPARSRLARGDGAPRVGSADAALGGAPDSRASGDVVADEPGAFRLFWILGALALGIAVTTRRLRRRGRRGTPGGRAVAR